MSKAEYEVSKYRDFWTDEEQSRFNEAFKLYGRNWMKVSKFVKTKTSKQVSGHADNLRKKLEKKKRDECEEEILSILQDVQIIQNYWTKDEEDKFLQALA